MVDIAACVGYSKNTTASLNPPGSALRNIGHLAIPLAKAAPVLSRVASGVPCCWDYLQVVCVPSCSSPSYFPFRIPAHYLRSRHTSSHQPQMRATEPHRASACIRPVRPW